MTNLTVTRFFWISTALLYLWVLALTVLLVK